MDFSILYWIQGLRSDFLDQAMVLLTKITGSYGQIWLYIAVLLLFFKKTRKSAVAVLISYALVYVFGQMILKDLIARPRPCHLDETVALLVSRPSSYSCPSTHSAWAFAAAASIFVHNKKIGTAALVLAVIIAFSRLYLFVHFPSDVLAGLVLGIICAMLAVLLIRLVLHLFHKKGVKS